MPSYTLHGKTYGPNDTVPYQLRHLLPHNGPTTAQLGFNLVTPSINKDHSPSVVDRLSSVGSYASNALSNLNPLPLRIEAAKHILDNRRKINTTKVTKDINSPLTFDEYTKACEFLNNAGFITKLKAFTPVSYTHLTLPTKRIV